MVSAVGQRPERARAPCAFHGRTEQPRTDAEEDAPTLSQPLSLLGSPWKRSEQRQPCILQLRQLLSGNQVRQKLTRHRLQARLCRCLDAIVELFEPLAPPGEPDRTEPRIAAAGDDVGERQVEAPQRRERGPDTAGQLLERDLAVVIEPALSDSRRPLPPRRPRTP